jgi:NAD(P) transhydrogenase subunit alpha
MILGVLAETYDGERRVALVPATCSLLAKYGFRIVLEKGAGIKAGFSDSSYEEQGVQVLSDRKEIIVSADIILCVRGLGANIDRGRADLDIMRHGQVVVGLLDPLGFPEEVKEFSGKGVTAFALELLPRISRAQPMDVLSSMAMVAGYKAILMAAEALPRMFPMMITAAGTVVPARVLVVGAGVAGLQAIATARRLGSVVQAYDVRPAVKEQVESLGAKFLELQLGNDQAEAGSGYARAMGDQFYRDQREMMNKVIAQSDVVITTAAVPGTKAPILITKDMVGGMKAGSVIVDLVAENGGNCEITRPGERVEENGITIIGELNLPSTVPYHASQMYAKNIAAFLQNLVKDGEIRMNMEDQIISESLLVHDGEVASVKVRELLGLPIDISAEGRRSGN